MPKHTAAEELDPRFGGGLGALPLQLRLHGFRQLAEAHLAAGNTFYSRILLSGAAAHVRIQDEHGPRDMLMFGSNNYLGLATDPAVAQAASSYLQDWGLGVAGPPLLNGTTALHQLLCSRLAVYEGQPEALLFASGYQANLAWVSTLLGENDVLVLDELAHASIADGLKLAGGSRPVAHFRFRHNDVDHLAGILDRLLRQRGLDPGHIFVYVEGVYSMEGDLAPLDRIVPLCEERGVALILDDAHGTGVTGPGGSGTAHHFGVAGRVTATMGTFSKTFTTAGGFLAASGDLVRYLAYNARPYIFSAHLPPTTVATVLACLDQLERRPELVDALHRNVAHLLRGLATIGLATSNRGSAIIPLLLPEKTDLPALMAAVHRRGIFLNAVQYPAVPLDRQRLRISVMATHTQADLDRLLEVLGELRDQFRHGEAA